LVAPVAFYVSIIFEDSSDGRKFPGVVKQRIGGGYVISLVLINPFFYSALLFLIFLPKVENSRVCAFIF